MRVVIINNDFKAYWRSRLLFLKRYLADNGIEFFAVELFGKGSPYLFDLQNGSLPWWHCIFPDQSALDLNKFQIKAGVDNELDRLKADIVIGPSIVFYPGALGIAWAKRNHKKFVMFDDARPSQFRRNFLVQGIKNLITAQADSLWLPSKKYDEEWGYFKKQGVGFFYGFNTVDNQFFQAKFAYDSKAKLIVCVARLVPVKNIDTLLKVWQIIEKQQHGYQLQIIGNGPQEQPLKQLAATLKLITVKFIDGADNNALPALLNRAAAFILPSLSETWGLAVNEAMAAGLPVLLSNTINATDDLLQKGVNGYGFDPENFDEMRQAVLNFIHLDQAAKVAMSTASLNIIENFTFDKMGMQLLGHLNWLYSQPVKKTSLPAAIMVRLWYGRYNTGVWDHLDRKRSVEPSKRQKPEQKPD